MLRIETGRIRLRHLELRDAPVLARYRSDVDVARYQSWDAMTLAEAKQLVTALPELFAIDDEWAQVAIADKATDELIGDIGICRKSSRGVVEIGFTLAPSAQGRGLASEACRAMLALIFSRPDVTAVEAVIDSRNAAAIGLVARLGMVLERTEPAEFKGELCTEHHFVLSRATFEAAIGRSRTVCNAAAAGVLFRYSRRTRR